MVTGCLTVKGAHRKQPKSKVGGQFTTKKNLSDTIIFVASYFHHFYQKKKCQNFENEERSFLMSLYLFPIN